ncbi:MAG: hypothetical protein JNM29_03105 [Candidatus Odyssella sp.]|nr:hypothetical protein [Candidatus Odyssella sp.]
MRRLFALALFVLAAAPAAQAEVLSSQFKGLASASREISRRIAPGDSPIELGKYLPAEDLERLLGSWEGFGNEHSFRNGVPNALNMVIWHATLSRFAAAVGESCATPRLPMQARFRATLKKVCAWPAESARDEAVLQEFWLALMGYQAPEAEYAAWRDFFRSAYAAKPATETVAAMTLAIAMNPYFLLHQ